jgi:outer membrane immunogenic protein
MLKYALAALALTAAASPALANEGRVEARGGIVWAGGGEEAVAGAAAGYDWDLGESAFIGVEGSADKILVDGIDVLFGATARVGAKLGENGRLYATGGYTFGEGDAAHIGAGYQHNLGESVYAKVEYRHFFDDFADLDAAVVGIGFRF